MAALSRTERLNTKLIAAPCHSRPTPGPTGVRPLVGFNPNRLVKDAGIRIDPPPSLAPATGTIPEATAAAAPPLEPPGEKFLCHGLRVAPCRAGSVIFLRATSGVFLYPVNTQPASLNFFTKLEAPCALYDFNSSAPEVIGSPIIVCPMFFIKIGTP